MPRVLEDAVWSGATHQIAPGRILLTVPGLGRALIQEDGGIAIAAEARADPADLRWLRERPAREALDLLRGRFALRAATVVIRGQAVALVGHGARGKSTAAAALALRGHGVLSDHRLDLDMSAGIEARPSQTALDLWPATVERLGLPVGDGIEIRPGLAKRAYRFQPAQAAPLRLVAVLDHGAGGGRPELVPLHGSDGVERLHAATVAGVLVPPLRLGSAHLRWMLEIASHTQMVNLVTDPHHADLQEVAQTVEALVT